MLIQPAQIQLCLSFVRCLQLANLQFHDHKPPQCPMIQQQVDLMVFPVDDDPPMARNKDKVASHLQQKAFDFAQNSVGEFFLTEGIGKPEK